VAKLVADGYAASAVRQVHRVLSLMLDLAVRDGRLPRNPATGVRLPRAAKGEPVFLTHTQVEQLAEACIDYELFVRGCSPTPGCAGVRPRRSGYDGWTL
jgi:integrase